VSELIQVGSERFVKAIADKRRVCCCICPATTLPHRDVCALFIVSSEPSARREAHGDDHKLTLATRHGLPAASQGRREEAHAELR
jgi:hypothetical protein